MATLRKATTDDTNTIVELMLEAGRDGHLTGLDKYPTATLVRYFKQYISDQTRPTGSEGVSLR